MTNVHMRWWGKCAVFVMFIIVLLAIFAPFIVPFAPEEQDLDNILAPISATHLLGSDYLGRDVFSRILYGARLSLGCVFIILVWIIFLGISIGGVCGFVGGKIDAICMRICDIFMSLPTIALSLFLVGVFGAGLENVMIAIILTHWAWYARVIRSIVFSLKNKEYVLLSFTFGASNFDRFKRHIITPVLAQCAVLASMDIGHIMLHIAGLSFLGLGVQPPTPEWGIMLSEAKDYMWDYPILIVYPGLALFITVAACNVISESLRDSFVETNSLRDVIDNQNMSRVKSRDVANSHQLEIRNLCIYSHSRKIIFDVSLLVKKGECRALLGRSGSGKSLSVLAMNGFLYSNLKAQIDVRLDSVKISPIRYRGILCAYIMQNPRTCFNPILSIGFHFKEICHTINKPYSESFARDILCKVNLDKQVLNMYPFELSGGMLQRVMIAIALFSQAPFIIADEPSSDLDKNTYEEILQILGNLSKQNKIGILLITHDLQIVANYAQYVYVMESGRVIERATLHNGRVVKDDLESRIDSKLQTPIMKHLQEIYKKETKC